MPQRTRDMEPSLRIAFYAPFKPLGHPRPSGDLSIGTGLFQYFEGRGHQIGVASTLRGRWISWKPWQWPQVIRSRTGAVRRSRALGVTLWLTYHTYFKAPDLLGPVCSRRLGVPYAIFQGIYSTKRRRDWRTLAGFLLNRRALIAADHVFTNRKEDFLNLGRIIPAERLTYVVPGLRPAQFRFDREARERLRRGWGVNDHTLVVSAAMFRPGVKSEGVAWVIRSCGELLTRHPGLALAIAGEGSEEPWLRGLAAGNLSGRVRFVGQLAREEMSRFYSAGDLFVFPGIRESLGMVYLEAQSCGLPVVAFADGGVPEVVADGTSGYLVRAFDGAAFGAAISRLLGEPDLRRKMGRAAADYVRRRHDLDHNYRVIETTLRGLTLRRRDE
jgi:phosphatidylinositol alpha-1,6-mannosyltransferase